MTVRRAIPARLQTTRRRVSAARFLRKVARRWTTAVGSPGTPVPLLTRLLLGHTLPVLLVMMALGLTLGALTRMTDLLEGVTDVELRSVKIESSLHQAIWRVDTALGHGHSACHAGALPEAVRADIGGSVERLKATVNALGGQASALGETAQRWIALAEQAQGSPACAVLGTDSFRATRDALDEDLTNLWSRRLAQLHALVGDKDAEARTIGSAAVRTGGLVALAAIALAVFLAYRMARAVSQPLSRLAETARQVGTGDFSTQVAVSGPVELQALAREFERMQAQLGELDHLKRGFLASVSHELRTPLSKLREALALLHDEIVGPLGPEQRRVVEIARRACEREIRMVSTLLDLSRLQAGGPIRTRSGHVLDEVIVRAVEEERVDARSRNVTVDVALAEPAPRCDVDQVLLERAIANLVRNAVSVSQPGQRVTVERGWSAENERGERLVRISVIDQGPGVPDDIRDTLFSPFVTRIVPRSPKALGVGLGLALAREVALAHGGDLLLDEADTGGATFHLLLPTAPSTNTASDSAPHGSAVGAITVAQHTG